MTEVYFEIEKYIIECSLKNHKFNFVSWIQ